MTSKIEKVNKSCLECNQEYEAHIGDALGIKIEFGGGYCPTCRQKKLDEEERIEFEARQKETASKRENWRGECGIPLRFRESRVDKFDTKVDKSIVNMWHECGEYINQFSFSKPQGVKSLVMYSQGIWGVGKTYLACAISNGILDKWDNETGLCPVCFVSEPQLFLRVRSTYNRRGNDDRNHQETEEEIYRHLTRVPLLILDDVGKEEVSDPRFVQRVLFAVIDGRYQNMLPMVITANLNPDELDLHLGGNRGNSASMDRLTEMTGNIFWELRGQSYRDMSKRNG